MEHSKKRIPPKIQIGIAVVLSLLIIAVGVTMAWFNYTRGLHTVSNIIPPVALEIGSGNKQPITQLELGNLDVENTDFKDVVFCVFSRMNKDIQYDLQLAHTTNIGLNYTIYPAAIDETSSDDSKTKVVYDNHTYTYDSKASVGGKELNSINDSGVANLTDDFFAKTYGKNANKEGYFGVQKNAMPIYWKSSAQLTLNSDNSYCNYFVLHIGWDEKVKNDKETDMIYIMADQKQS